MTRRRLTFAIFAIVLLTGLAIMAYSARHDLRAWWERTRSDEDIWFAQAIFPYETMTYLYDLGIVDANGDGHLDIYTSNHNYRQHLLLADGQGGYREGLSAWGLDQDPSFPGTEQHRDPPRLDRPGLYIYWQGDVLHVLRHRTREWAPLRGRLEFYNRIEIVGSEGFETRIREISAANAAVPAVRLEFAAATDGVLRIYPRTRGTPIRVELEAPWLEHNVFLGAEKRPVVGKRLELTSNDAAGQPTAFCRWCQGFELNVRDRHAMLWADYNGDGRMDVFINRGALGGMLRHFPPQVREHIGDEFLISTVAGRHEDRSRAIGLRKNDCSARHARWVDFDRDGRLDLFINCQDRGMAGGAFPKQLYRQQPDGRLEEVAAKVGLDLPDRQLVDMVWFDADADGWIDLLTHEDSGFYLYRNDKGGFTRTFIGRGPFHRDQVPNLKGETTDYWQFDGKLSLADMDHDGDLDVFMSSKKGNALLLNHAGRLVLVPPERYGLPRASVAAAWVDYDNDGRIDLHTVPQGIYRQRSDGTFQPTGMFRLPDNKYQAAFIQWYDRDNDGRLDLLLALQDNASLWRWWERLYKRADVKGRDDRFVWTVQAYSNVGPAGKWLQLELKGGLGNPQAIGAYVRLKAGTSYTAAQIGAQEGAYSSQGHYRLYFGLGDMEEGTLEVLWPTGELDSHPKLRSGRLAVIRPSACSLPCR